MDPFGVLDLQAGATSDEIKRAFRAKIMQWHPDRHGGSREAQEKTREIVEAYQALRNPDRTGAGPHVGDSGPRGAWFFDMISVLVEAFGAWAGMMAARSEESTDQDFVDEIFDSWREQDTRRKSGVDDLMEEILS